MKTALAVLICISLAGCTGKAILRKDGKSTERPMSITGIAKSDVDEVTELAQRETITGLKRLSEKLYRRNPGELQKSGAASLEDAIADIFNPVNHWHLSARRNLDWQASINGAFDVNFSGDRVGALMKGLLTMVMASYEHKAEIYLVDNLDPQKLYNSARNLEIAAWRLSNGKSASGELFLLSNSIGADGMSNLSFEREFGKLIATQDLIARVIEDKTNRTIRFSVINAASLVFLPI